MFGSRGEPLPEVRKALIEDAPRLVRLTIWGLVAFVLFLVLWAHFAIVDEVTRGEGKAIPSSRLQKIQNLEGGIVAELFAREGQIVEAGDPLLRLDDTRFASNVGETEADRLALAARVERLSAEVEGRDLALPENVLRDAPTWPIASAPCSRAAATSCAMKSVDWKSSSPSDARKYAR